MKHFAGTLLSLLLLSPVAHAQSVTNSQDPLQASPQSIPVPLGTLVTLVSMEPVMPGAAKKGSAVRFAVAEDVAINGSVIIPAGEPVTGVVVKEKAGRSENHKGRLEIRINPIQLGTHASLRLIDSNPKIHLSPLVQFKDAASVVGECIILLPVCLYVEGIFHQGSKDAAREYGLDFLPGCVVLQFWTASSATIPAAEIHSSRAHGAAEIQESCPALSSSKPGVNTPYLRYVKFR